LERAHVVIVVFDVSDVISFMSLGEWMDDIKKIGRSRPSTIVVANKIDLRSSIEHCITGDQFESEAGSIGFDRWIEASAKTGEHVASIFDATIDLCSGKPAYVPAGFAPSR
jgi:predicted GTPase